jgi:ubiquinone/menaquinone biosynthesis C-methylase UbiE
VWWLLWQTALRAWRKLWPRPRPPWLGHGLLDRLRPVVWPASTLVARFKIEPGTRVIDVGAGRGRLTAELVAKVGAAGHVIAVDDRLDVVENLQVAALTSGQANLTVQHAPPTLLPVETGTMDLVVLTSVVGGEPDKAALMAEVYRVLRPGGRVAISEFVVDPDYCLASTVVTNLVLAGLGIVREIGGFAGYTVIGRKPDRHGDP